MSISRVQVILPSKVQVLSLSKVQLFSLSTVQLFSLSRVQLLSFPQGVKLLFLSSPRFSSYPSLLQGPGLIPLQVLSYIPLFSMVQLLTLRSLMDSCYPSPESRCFPYQGSRKYYQPCHGYPSPRYRGYRSSGSSCCPSLLQGAGVIPLLFMVQLLSIYSPRCRCYPSPGPPVIALICREQVLSLSKVLVLSLSSSRYRYPSSWLSFLFRVQASSLGPAVIPFHGS